MIGQPVPQIGRLALVRGHCTYLDRTALAGRWLALCFLSSPTVSNLTYLNAQAEAFARDGAALLVVLSDTSLLRIAQHEDIRPFMVPLLPDILNRMHRSYGVALHPPSAMAVTFLVDPLRVLRFDSAHDLALWDLAGLRGLLNTKRTGMSEPPHWAVVAQAGAEAVIGDGSPREGGGMRGRVKAYEEASLLLRGLKPEDRSQERTME